MEDDEIDLTNAILFCDGSSGVYIPQRFANEIKPECLKYANTADIECLKIGPTPKNEWYWEAWDSVLSNAKVVDKNKEYYLHQDDDLWLVPIK